MAAGTDFAALTRKARLGTAGTLGAPAAGASPTSGGGAALKLRPAAVGQIGGLSDSGAADTTLPSRAVAHAPSITKPSPFARLAKPEASAPAEDEVPTEVPSAANPFNSLVSEVNSHVTRTARADMAAAKVLSRLVAAIARKPGSGVPDAVKSRTLSALLRSTRDAALRLVTSLAPLDAHRGWLQAQAQEAAATLVASQWEASPLEELLPVDEHLEAIEGIFQAAGRDPSLADALADLGAAQYVEATSSEVAVARMAMSVRLAAWDLLSCVRHPTLREAGTLFSYGLEPSAVVERLMPALVAIAKEGNIRVGSLDLRTTHFQSSIRRLAELMGAEYISRTQLLLAWIEEPGQGQMEADRRRNEAWQQFEGRICADLVAWVRSNFLAVERSASKMMEDTKDELTPAERN